MLRTLFLVRPLFRTEYYHLHKDIRTGQVFRRQRVSCYLQDIDCICSASHVQAINCSDQLEIGGLPSDILQLL